MLLETTTATAWPQRTQRSQSFGNGYGNDSDTKINQGRKGGQRLFTTDGTDGTDVETATA